MEMLGQAAVFLWRCCADIGLYGSLRLVLVIEPMADQRRRFGQIAGEDVLAVIVATTHVACQRGGGIAGVIFNRRTVWHCPDLLHQMLASACKAERPEHRLLRLGERQAHVLGSGLYRPSGSSHRNMTTGNLNLVQRHVKRQPPHERTVSTA